MTKTNKMDAVTALKQAYATLNNVNKEVRNVKLALRQASEVLKRDLE